MVYGSVLADNVQSSAVGLAPVFKDGGGTEIGELCRAWVNFVGSTGAIRASFNVSSVTRNGVGDYSVNFVNSMPDVNYAAMTTGFAGSGGLASSGGLSYEAGSSNTVSYRSVSAFRLFTLNSTYNNSDAAYVSVSIFR